MKNMKKLIVLLLALCMAFSLVACGSKEKEASDSGSDLEAIKDAGTLNIGITLYEPMNYKNKDGKLVGFDTEYAEAVCKKLGVKANFVEINWDTKETELKSKNIDCIWNGFTIRDDLKEQITFTDPYIKNKQVVVIQKKDKNKYKTKDDFDGVSVAAETGSAGENVIKTDKELGNVEVVSVGKQTDALTEVKSGTSTAAVLDYTLAFSMVGDGTDYKDLMIVDGLDLAVEEYGIGCRKGSDLADAINDATKEMIDDGSLDKIATTYGLDAILISNEE